MAGEPIVNTKQDVHVIYDRRAYPDTHYERTYFGVAHYRIQDNGNTFVVINTTRPGRLREVFIPMCNVLRIEISNREEEVVRYKVKEV